MNRKTYVTMGALVVIFWVITIDLLMGGKTFTDWFPVIAVLEAVALLYWLVLILFPIEKKT